MKKRLCDVERLFRGDEMLNQELAVKLAVKAVKDSGARIAESPPRVLRLEQLQQRNPKPGWLIIVPLNVPEGFSPNNLHVEVHEPDGEVLIHRAI